LSYTDDQQKALDAWVNNGEAMNAPAGLIIPSAGPVFSPDFSEIWKKIYDTKKILTTNSLYDKTYFLLMSAIKLFSSCENEKILGCLEKKFSIYSPAQRYDMLEQNGVVAPEKIEDEMYNFTMMLRQSPRNEWLRPESSDLIPNQ
jgi:hypothetical protein